MLKTQLSKYSILSSTDVLRFDNTYSIFQAKRISYSVEVLLPDHLQPAQNNGKSGDHVEVECDSQL